MPHSLVVVFFIGFTYSLYHCIGMCGGFVAAYSATCGAANQAAGGGYRRVLAQWPVHLLFNLGRVTSYSIIGLGFGFAGSWANYYGRLSGTRLQGIAGVAGGILMILFALSLAGIMKMPAGTLLGGSVVRRWFNRLLRSRSIWRTYPLGMLVGTVPCGLVYSMSSYALASGSALRGGMIMACFGLGTVPAMFSFGFVSTALSSRLRRGMLAVAVILTIAMGIEAIHRGMSVLS